MKKFIPAIIAIALILIVVAGSFGMKLKEKYSYSDEQQNLEEYYDLLAAADIRSVAVVLQNERIPNWAKLIDGRCYMELEDVQALLNTRFYHDENEGLLIYTTPTQKIIHVIGSNAYSVDGAEQPVDYAIAVQEGESLYLALDYVKQYTNFSYELFTEPNRMQLRTEWGSRDSAVISKDTHVRVKGGIKSPILRALSEGETVTVLEEMETWTKIKTDDVMIGYVENKFLKGHMTEDEIPV